VVINSLLSVLHAPLISYLLSAADRWLFRYVMTFLRDGTLPDDRQLLSQLYREAVHWNLASMQRAIEEERVSVMIMFVRIILLLLCDGACIS
jgi:hypothetical protein